MDNILFSKSFSFNTCLFKKYHFTDNSRGCQFHYIGYIKKGHVDYICNNYKLHFAEGDIFYIPINLSYRSYWYGSPDIIFESFGFSYFPNRTGERYPLQKIDVDDQIKQMFDVIKTCGNHSCKNIGLFYSALGSVIPLMKKHFSDKNEQIVSKAIEYMTENTSRKMSEVAKHCNVSESGLYNIFRSTKNCTPNEMRQKIQISNAKRLLISTDLSVELISDKCGFCNAGYFRKVFKTVTGKLPREYRKRPLI